MPSGLVPSGSFKPADPEGGAMSSPAGELLRRWARWREGQALAAEDPAEMPVGTGALGGVVRGSTPAAEGLANFVRRVWPSLGRKADSLPDITLHYGKNAKIPDFPSAGGVFRGSSNDIGNNIEIPGTINAWSHGGHMPINAHTAVQNYIHELLHAIYKSKGNQIGPMQPYGTNAAHKIFEKLGRGMMPERRAIYEGQARKATEAGNYYATRDAEAHGSLDAMTGKIFRKRIGDASKVAEGFR